MAETRRTGSRVAAAVLALLVSASTAPATGYGDVEVTIESEPKGTATHGYAEVWVRVANRSTQAPHTVRLTLPKSSYSPGTDHLRAASRTVTVEPGKAARVAIAYPERIPLNGNGLGVAIDGREQEDPVRVNISGSHGYSRAGGGGFGGGYGVPQRLVLYSKTIDTRFPDWVTQAQTRELVGAFGGIGSNTEYVRADQPAAGWSPNWLSYTRYDGVVATADDLRTMPAEARAAVGQYVECGGSLLVFGADAPLPGPWKPERMGERRPSLARVGFGECYVADEPDVTRWSSSDLGAILDSWTRTGAPWQRDQTPAYANRAFPVVDDVGVPVKGLLALMFVFAVVIGPVNLYLLGRKRRKLWLFWTVPLVSLVTCLGVFAYMAITEGWQGRTRAEAFTVIDENTRRASTIGWTAYYTPLLPGGGLHFSPDTEVAFQNGDDSAGGHSYSRRRRSGAAALTLDWTRDQHLASGWLTPRVPAHFVVRKGESRRERVTVTKGPDGRPEAVNGLGADLTELWYSDEGGNLFRAGAVPAGGRATLEPANRPDREGRRPTLRDVYAGEWHNVVTRVKADGPALLAPRTYLAVMDAAPFLDDALPGASVRKARSVVLGILREGGDEG